MDFNDPTMMCLICHDCKQGVNHLITPTTGKKHNMICLLCNSRRENPMPQECPGCHSGIMAGRVERFECKSTFNPMKGTVMFSKDCLKIQIRTLKESNKRLIDENRSLREK